jgi:Rod binding domain-containing protein
MTGAIALPLPGAPLPIGVAEHDRPLQAQDELRRAAEEFEAVFLAEMLAPMFESLDTEGIGGGGMGEEIFRPMLVERYAESISRAGGVGIADSIVRELVRLQETQPAPAEAADGADR